MNKGILVVLSGFSGAGKGTIMGRLLSDHKDAYALSISATTRAPREGEEEGRSYFFVSKERFEQMIEAGELLEHACYVGNYYGTPRAYVEEQMNAGRSVILEIELQGAVQIRERFPETKLLFVTPPTAQELRDRLVGRGTETSAQIEDRLSRAYEESEYIGQYDYLIVNDNLDRAVEEIHRVIQAERDGEPEQVREYLVSGNQELAGRLREELRIYAKGE